MEATSGEYGGWVMTGLFFGYELLHNKGHVALCGIVMQKQLSLPATCRTASFEVHPETSGKLASRNDQ
jgi:hypothetical protein